MILKGDNQAAGHFPMNQFHKEASNGDIQLLKEFCMEALEQYPERNVGVR